VAETTGQKGTKEIDLTDFDSGSYYVKIKVVEREVTKGIQKLYSYSEIILWRLIRQPALVLRVKSSTQCIALPMVKALLSLQAFYR
jgi:hypothetical protein